MGKATVDLPDPLDKASAGGADSADDLLSQLAGEEIDRLLSQAEVEKSDAAPGAEESSAPAAIIENATIETPPAAMAEVAPPIAASAEATKPAEAPAGLVEAGAEEIEGDLSTQLDALFDELSTSPEATTKKHAPEPAPVEAATAPTPPKETIPVEPAAPAVALAMPELLPKADASPASTVAAPATLAPPAHVTSRAPAAEGETSHAEREGLTPAASHDELLNPALAPDAPAVAEKTDSLPLLFRPLAWINAPIAMFPEPVREALGKIAILTLINALAVLAYVLMFRRH